MICNCGHHAAADPELGGEPVTLSRPAVALHGRLICRNAADMMTALDLLPAHVTASRAEPGCLLFRIEQSDNPMEWSLAEIFADAAAFTAHQTRTAASLWGQLSRDMGRDFHRHEVQPRIRPESPADGAALDALLGDGREGRILQRLREDGDLAHSLIAHLEGHAVGHVALSPMQAARPALALGLLTVHPALRGRGLARALINAAVAVAGPLPVVGMGQQRLFAACGFHQAALVPDVDGAVPMIHGTLPAGSAIRHARAFSGL
ncbi:GNAT family N-acetyltransferase [Paracoccus sp. NSM]|uniref:GNAT family N-acetyltransferase n=1 Tax=Paracoccus sp. NSM TaxID=3457784 RepID=UPI0040370612